MSEFFIKRPNFAWVVALFISLAGLLVISKLPVAQYPNVAPPQITITATYPGASAKVLVDSVTSVLEESLNGAKGLLYFESTNNTPTAPPRSSSPSSRAPIRTWPRWTCRTA